MAEEKPEMKDAKATFAAGQLVSQHKGKVAIGGILATVGIVLLKIWPMVCPLIPYNLECEAQKPLIEAGKSKLQEVIDNSNGGGNE